MEIKLLSSSTINRIAAGEVVERPSSAIKELIENSIDAKATKISILIAKGGRNEIIVEDDGIGMTKEQIHLAIQRHTTSKLDESDISDIRYFGFRGEALPSIASISKFTINSKYHKHNDYGWKLELENGEIISSEPSPIALGTKISIRDIFYCTPARLKFLKSEKSESQNIIELIKKFAISHHNIEFNLFIDGKHYCNYKTCLADNAYNQRLNDVLGTNFTNNSLAIQSTRNNISLSGRISIPTYNKKTSSDIYLFVNNRSIKDKLLISYIKIACQDYIPHNTYPAAIIDLTLPVEDVDVNVHPAKTEVRFKNINEIREIIFSSIKTVLTKQPSHTSTHLSDILITQLAKNNNLKNYHSQIHNNSYKQNNFFRENFQESFIPVHKSYKLETELNSVENETKEDDNTNFYPLGSAKCQLFTSYIISQNTEEIFIIDQHAAHERIVYEELKNLYYSSLPKSQLLLTPEIIELKLNIFDHMLVNKSNFAKLGLNYEKFGNNAIKITEIPIMISNDNISTLITSLAEEIEELDDNSSFEKNLNKILSTFACHHSIRKGRSLNISEMNNILRKIENNPAINQCNHGRPSYVKLTLKEIDKLFERS